VCLAAWSARVVGERMIREDITITIAKTLYPTLRCNTP